MGGSGGGILYGPRASFPPQEENWVGPCAILWDIHQLNISATRGTSCSVWFTRRLSNQNALQNIERESKLVKRFGGPPEKPKKTSNSYRNSEPRKTNGHVVPQTQKFQASGDGWGLATEYSVHICIRNIYIYMCRERVYIYIQMCLLMNLSREPPQSVCGHASPPN